MTWPTAENQTGSGGSIAVQRERPNNPPVSIDSKGRGLHPLVSVARISLGYGGDFRVLTFFRGFEKITLLQPFCSLPNLEFVKMSTPPKSGSCQIRKADERKGSERNKRGTENSCTKRA